MRYAVLSDIHANLQAWNAVLLDIRSLHVDKIICLGDIVGYGPNPAQVLESVYANVDHFVLGNHDAVLCGKLDDSLFNDSARSILAWTKSQVGRNALQFMSNLPLALDGQTFRCVHGDFSEPSYFNYIIDPKDALSSWQSTSEQLLFVGHTHVPSIFLLGRSGRPHVVPPQDFELEPEKRYIVNPGSVGQPRDGETRASYCIYDTEAGSVCWRRIPFDIDAYRKSVETAGIPVAASYFLNCDPRNGVSPLREILSFSPASTPEMAARNVTEVHTLQVLQKRVRKWRSLFIIAILAMLSIIAIVFTVWIRAATRRETIASASASASTDAGLSAVDRNLLSLPTAPVPAGQAIPGWIINLGDKRRQSVRVDNSPADHSMIFVLDSASDQDLSISSPQFEVKPQMKFQMECSFKQAADFQGEVRLEIQLTRGTTRRTQTAQYNPKLPTMKRRDGWMAASGTFTLPEGSILAQLRIYGRFTGEVWVKDISFERKKQTPSEP